MNAAASFWQKVDALLASSTVRIDRPKGSAHPRYPNFIYPLDYGYLENTQGGDGDGIDIWIGSLAERHLLGAVATVDLVKRDMELKLLLGCTEEEVETVLAVHQAENTSAVLILR